MMRKIADLFKNPFLSGSLVMIIGSNVYNGGQFVYHFLSGRFLGKAYYGDLAAIISILGIIGIVQLALSLTIVKFITAEKDDKKLVDFIKWIYRMSIWAGLIVGIIVSLISPLITNFLHIAQPLAVFLLGPIIFSFIVILTCRAVLQGLLQFNRYVVSLLIEAFVKLTLTVVLILLGFAVVGAVGAILIAVLCSFIFTRISLSPYLKGKRESNPDLKPLLKYSGFVLIQGLALTSMYSSDLILVKHFFSAEEAGLYAALAILGRVVFFGASPITQVMFPLISKRHSNDQDYKNIFYASVLLVVGLTAFVTLIYYLVPQIPLGVLYGKSFLDGTKLLWWYALFMSFLAVSMLLTQFYLSVHKTKVSLLFAVAAISQLVLIWFMHNSLLGVIQISIAVSALLVLALLLYFPYHRR